VSPRLPRGKPGPSQPTTVLCCIPLQGLLLPLAGSGTCTIREAVILSSVINRCSLPVLHSAAALLRLAQMEYSGVTSYFIRILLDKKYALPLKVRTQASFEWAWAQSSWSANAQCCCSEPVLYGVPFCAGYVSRDLVWAHTAGCGR
jgi:hypothetical protein